MVVERANPISKKDAKSTVLRGVATAIASITMYHHKELMRKIFCTIEGDEGKLKDGTKTTWMPATDGRNGRNDQGKYGADFS